MWGHATYKGFYRFIFEKLGKEAHCVSRETSSLSHGREAFSIQGEPKPEKPVSLSSEGLLDSLKKLQDDLGQLLELTSEEKKLVEALLESFSKLMKPLAATVPVSAEVLADRLGNVDKATIDPKGLLVVLHKDGRVKLLDLMEESQRDLLVDVMKDIVPKLSLLTSTYRQRVEERINFLSILTREFQRISKTFATSK